MHLSAAYIHHNKIVPNFKLWHNRELALPSSVIWGREAEVNCASTTLSPSTVSTVPRSWSFYALFRSLRKCGMGGYYRLCFILQHTVRSLVTSNPTITEVTHNRLESCFWTQACTARTSAHITMCSRQALRRAANRMFTVHYRGCCVILPSCQQIFLMWTSLFLRKPLG